MYIVLASPECAPAAKAGGLGDFVHGLGRELAIRGNDVEIVLPKYDSLRFDRIEGLHKAYGDLLVPFYDRHIHCDVECGDVDGVRCFFIDAHSEQNFSNVVRFMVPPTMRTVSYSFRER